jgi:hypothetical protein
MSKQTYYEKLKDPRWQRKRLEVMERDNFTCRSCGCNDKTLNVHHKTYRKNAEPWDYDDDNFITYCEDCHGSVHAEKDFLMMNVDTVRKLGVIANIACFCTDDQIEKMRALTAIGALQKGQELNLHHYVNAAKDAECIITDCKKFIALAKKKIKESKKQ